MKQICKLVCAALMGVTLVMLWMHRRLIVAAIKGEKLPDAPKGCPAYKG